MEAFKLVAKLVLDSDDFDRELKTSRSKLAGVGSAIGTAAKVGAAALATATAAVGKFAADSVATGKVFDASMSQVAATMGYTVEELNTEGSEAAKTFETLSNFAQEMGSATAFSASQAADALNYMALAGYDADTSMEMLPNVLNLAAAGGIELAAASDMVTDAQSALGLTLPQTTELVDKMAKASSKSNTSVQQLGDAILTIGGTAKSMAGGTTELTAALGILADNGIKGAEGGTALRNVLLGIQSDKFEKTFGELGVAAYDSNGNLRELSDILSDMNAVMDDMTDQQKTSLINDTFNRQDLKTVNALLATEVDRWEELSAAIDGSAGAAQAMAEVQLDNLEGDITLFKSALEGAQIAVSNGLTPEIRKFVQFGSDGLSKLTKAFKEDGLNGAMDALGKILSDGIALIMDELPTLVDAGMSLLGAVAKGIVDNMPAIAKAAVEILTKLATTLADSADDIGPAVVDVVLEIVKVLTSPDTLVSLASAAMKIMVGLYEGLIKAIPDLIEAIPIIIKNLIEAIVAALPQIIASGMELIINLGQGLLLAIPQLVMAIPQILAAIVGGIIDGVKDVVKAGKQIVQGLIDGILGMGQALAEKIKGFVDGFIGTFKNLLGIHSPSTVFAGFGENLIGGLMNGLSEKWQTLKSRISDIASSVKDGFMEKVNAAATWGRDLATNFGAGITNALSSVKSAVSTAANAVKSFLGFSEPDEGPLSNFHTFAPDMMKLFAEGIRENESVITDQIAKSFDFGEQVVGGTASRGYSSVSSPASPITIIVQSVLDGKVIGETAYKYNLSRARAVGG